MVSQKDRNESNLVGNLIMGVGIFAIIISAISAYAYAVINDYISELLRILIGFIISFLFIGGGVFLYEKKPSWSLFSMAGGLLLGIITIYFAHHQYVLISSMSASLFILAYMALFFYLSFIYNSQIIISYAGIGGLFVPSIGGFLDSHLLLSYGYYLTFFFTIAIICALKKWNFITSISLVLLFFPLIIMFNLLDPVIALMCSIFFAALLFSYIIIVSKLKTLPNNFKLELAALTILLILYLLFSIPLRFMELNYSNTLESVIYLLIACLMGSMSLNRVLENNRDILTIISGLGSIIFLNIGVVVYFVGSSLLGIDGIYFLFLFQWVVVSYLWAIYKKLELFKFLSFVGLIPIIFMFLFMIRFDQGLFHATIMLVGLILLPVIAHYLADMSSDKTKIYFYSVSLISAFFFIYSSYKFLFFFFAASSQIPSVILTVMWMLLSLFYIYLFIEKEISTLKSLAYFFLAISIGKILLNDLLILEGFARIIGFLVIGVLLILGGYIFTTKKDN